MCTFICSQCSAQHKMLPHHLMLFIRIVTRTAAAAAATE